jgi:Lsr2
MAQKVQTLYIDDIDGSDAEGTIHFGLDGAEYESDLNAAHSQELRTSLQAYTIHARKVGGTRRASRGARRNAGAIDTHAVRAWARDHGIGIKERGRVPADVVARYREATGQEETAPAP